MTDKQNKQTNNTNSLKPIEIPQTPEPQIILESFSYGNTPLITPKNGDKNKE